MASETSLSVFLLSLVYWQCPKLDHRTFSEVDPKHLCAPHFLCSLPKLDLHQHSCSVSISRSSFEAGRVLSLKFSGKEQKHYAPDQKSSSPLLYSAPQQCKKEQNSNLNACGSWKSTFLVYAGKELMPESVKCDYLCVALPWQAVYVISRHHVFPALFQIQYLPWWAAIGNWLAKHMLHW